MEVVDEILEFVGGDVDVADDWSALAVGIVVEIAGEGVENIAEVGRVFRVFGDGVGGFWQKFETFFDFFLAEATVVAERGVDKKTVGEVAGQRRRLFPEFFSGLDDVGIIEIEFERVEFFGEIEKIVGGAEGTEGGKEMVGSRWDDFDAKDDLGDDAEGALGAKEDGEKIENFAVVAAAVDDGGIAGEIAAVAEVFENVGVVGDEAGDVAIDGAFDVVGGFFLSEGVFV